MEVEMSIIIPPDKFRLIKQVIGNKRLKKIMKKNRIKELKSRRLNNAH